MPGLTCWRNSVMADRARTPAGAICHREAAGASRKSGDTGRNVPQADDTVRHCGFVAIIGAPNAGKSSLMNGCVAQKVAIVTHKVQTTRTRIRAIATHGCTQIVFVDTPGIFHPAQRFDRAMVGAALSASREADIVALVVDSARKDIEIGPAVRRALRRTQASRLLVLNKIDLVPRTRLLQIADHLQGIDDFARIFMVSARTGSGVPDLLDDLAARLPPGPWLFEPDTVRDAPTQLTASEITREKLMLRLHQELPYELTVETESVEHFHDGALKIAQTVYVVRESHKRMIVGKGGTTIKAIGAAARADMGRAFDRRVHLSIFVKIRRDWRENPAHYRALGLDYQA